MTCVAAAKCLPQREFEENVRALGFDYLIWDSWSAAEAFIRHCRLEGAYDENPGGTD